ncbi:MAG: hypothetical protein V1877_01990 [Candidatus Tagabacteria bacterium]
MNSSLSRIAREAKAIFFQKHPGRKPQEAELIDITLSLMDSYFEARERLKSQEKNRKPKLYKNGNHGFHKRLRLVKR